jgi:hypothetical protein
MSRRRFRRLLQLCLAAVAALVPVVVQAHAIHTTLTVMTAAPGGLTFTVRSFADDFSASVARHAGHAVPRDSSVRADEVVRYVRAQFEIRDADGRALTLESCGLRREGGLYFACFRAATADGLGGVRVRNRMLTELHVDQVNIVQVDGRGTRRTLLFTRASAPSVLSASA